MKLQLLNIQADKNKNEVKILIINKKDLNEYISKNKQ